MHEFDNIVSEFVEQASKMHEMDTTKSFDKQYFRANKHVAVIGMAFHRIKKTKSHIVLDPDMQRILDNDESIWTIESPITKEGLEVVLRRIGIIESIGSRFTDNSEDKYFFDVIAIDSDSSVVLSQVVKLLIQGGSKVIRVNKGTEAARLLTVKNFDFILVDIHAPVLEGIEDLRFSRDHEVAFLSKQPPARHSSVAVAMSSSQSTISAASPSPANGNQSVEELTTQGLTTATNPLTHIPELKVTAKGRLEMQRHALKVYNDRPLYWKWRELQDQSKYYSPYTSPVKLINETRKLISQENDADRRHEPHTHVSSHSIDPRKFEYRPVVVPVKVASATTLERFVPPIIRSIRPDVPPRTSKKFQASSRQFDLSSVSVDES